LSDVEKDRLEVGRLLFAGPIAFERGVPAMEHLPEADVPEVAFAGRSNVGKSSLINALTGRNKLARASTEPGRTRELNFFRMGDRLRLVDMPGYGYAKAAKADIERWNELTRDYLRGRPTLKRVISAVNYQLVLTKADKIKPTELAVIAERTSADIAKRPAAHPEIIATSADTGQGIEALRAEIAALAT
jgi:GTP-binding protein